MVLTHHHRPWKVRADDTLTNCMMTFIEVEVDTESGTVSLIKIVNATDAGTIIDPQGSRRTAQRVSRLRV